MVITLAVIHMGTSNNDGNRSEFFLTDLAVQISEIFFFGDEPPRLQT